jgi:hypothetical protein
VHSIRVLKRFNSRKLPHLLELTGVNDDGTTSATKARYIFKENDDISTDAAVMALLKRANELWAKNGCEAQLRTYDVVAFPDQTGFVSVVPGETMLNVHALDIIETLGGRLEMVNRFFQSLVAVVVVTAAFDITDRHHNNVMFTPDGDIALIDLSASLGKRAPMDEALTINPIYLPRRLRVVLQFLLRSTAAWVEEFDWNDFVEACMRAYFVLLNNKQMRTDLAVEHSFTMPAADRFLALLAERKSDAQSKEATRNKIVATMENSRTVTRIVSSLAAVVGAN